MVLPFGQLLKQSRKFAWDHRKQLAIGALLFGLLLGVLQQTVLARFERDWRLATYPGYERLMDRHRDRFNELGALARDGDVQAIRGMMEEMAKMTEISQEVGMGRVPKGGKWVDGSGVPDRSVIFTGVVGYVLMVLLMLLAAGYYLTLAVTGERDVQKLLRGGWRVMFHLFLVGVWSFLRSFGWIPVIGLIPAFILMPRFMFAPQILVAEGAGVRESVSLSYKRTRGYWGKIVGNSILFGATMLFAAILPFFLLAVLLVFVGLVAARSIALEPYALWSITQWIFSVATLLLFQLIYAFQMIFNVRLGETIMKSPRFAPLPPPRAKKKPAARKPAKRKKESV